MEKEFKNMWAYVYMDQPPEFWTVFSTRKSCIEKCLDGTQYTWKQAKSFGWKCIKVDVTIKAVK